jgi:hypothetical protein
VHAQIAFYLDVFDRAELPVGQVTFAVWRGELRAVANREGAVGFAIERDALEAPLGS